jgi:hypothetical protein
VQKIQQLVEAIRTGVPAVSNLRVALGKFDTATPAELSTEIGFGIYESHLRGGVAVHPPIPNRQRWVSSW